MALTKILDKLVQVGPGYLDQTLRTFVAENRHYKFYTDTANNKSYAVAAFYTSGELVLKQPKKADILIVGAGGGSSIGNLSGGSGAGSVINIEEAMLPASHYGAFVGAGGAGGTLSSWSDPTPQDSARGSLGNESSFGYIKKEYEIIAAGGGVGGYRDTDTVSLAGGCGGGAGGAERDGSGNPTSGVTDYGIGAANTVDITVPYYITNQYFGGNVYSYSNDGGDSDPWYIDPSYNPGGQYTYHAGGGGGAGTRGGTGDDTKGGNGGDGITIPWVNEVFKEVFHFNGDVYWGGGGGGAASTDEEPGNGGLGGGGGGASINSVGNTDQKIYRNGKGDKRGINPGFDADKLLGGAGGKNTGGGAGGSTAVSSTTTGHIPNIQGNNGGSGFVLVRIHLDDAFSPYSASL